MTTARRFLPSEPAEFARALVPLVLLALAAAIPALRIIVVVGIAAGVVVAIGRAAPVRWAWAAALPVAVSLAWGAWPMPVAAASAEACTDPGSPLAVWRALEAVVVLGVLAALAVVLRAPLTSMSLRLPARRYRGWAVAGLVVAGPLALVVGPFLAEPFFGDVGYELSLAALVPAAIFAVSNGVMEEVVYRGALLGWTGRVMGIGPALLGQAVVFGLAHSGPDVLGSPVVLMVLLGLGGLLAGVITVRTRSLLIPIAVHVGLDLPLFFGLACGS